MKKFMMIVTTALLIGSLFSIPASAHDKAAKTEHIQLLSSRGAGS
ncbi:hypothetical protein [Bacillus safensis]|nr:hypothetical protein [Bacillus safensis]